MSLPLPSSPHWVPTTTVAGTRLLRSLGASDYAPLYPPRNGGPKWGRCDGARAELAAVEPGPAEPALARHRPCREHRGTVCPELVATLAGTGVASPPAVWFL